MQNQCNSGIPSKNQLFKFLNTVFAKENYGETVPLLFDNYPNENHFFKKTSNKLESFCATYSCYWQINNRIIKGTCIGAVATLPEFTGKGYASDLIKQAEKTALRDGSDLVFLFSDLHTFYSKLNYSLVGSDYLIEFSANFSANNEILLNKLVLNLDANKYIACDYQEIVATNDLIKHNPNIFVQIWNYIESQQNRCETILSFREFLATITIPNLKILLVKKNSQINALAFYGKGDDFQNIIHGVKYTQSSDFLYLLQKFRLANLKLHFFLLLPPKPDTWLQNFHLIKNETLYVKPLSSNENDNILLINNIEKQHIYPRTLQSS